jgi:hypothetical protein
MFVNRNISQVWDGDLSKLTSDQLAKMVPLLEQIAAESEQVEVRGAGPAPPTQVQ